MGWVKSFLPNKKSGAISFEKTVEYLQNTPFFQYLTPETINEFAECFPTTLRSRPGENISLDPPRIYVVAEGAVDLLTLYPVGGSKVEAKGFLCRKRHGDIVNLNQAKKSVEQKMSAIKKLKELAEDIVAVGCGDTSILLLCADIEALENFRNAHPELSEPFDAIVSTQIEDRLLSIPFLQNCPKLSVLSAMCQYEAFDAGQVVFEENSEATKLYFVLSGVAHVVANSPSPSFTSVRNLMKQHEPSETSLVLQRSLECSGEQKPFVGTDEIAIAELKSGDYFGETALVFKTDRTCSVKTKEKCLFLTVHKTDFENFLKICPIGDALKSVITKRMVSKLSSLNIPFLTGIPDDMISSLATSVELIEVPKDHVIFRQGDEGDKFFIVVHGSVKVETVSSASSDDNNGSGEAKLDEKTVQEEAALETSLGKLGPGQYFGEMALVSKEERGLRSATVTSVEKSILLSVDKDSFQTIFGSNKQVLAEFELRVLKSTAELKHVLAHSLGANSFRNYLEKEHAGENIDFWLAVRDFMVDADTSHEAPMSDSERLERAQYIFKTFCADYADRQVNLPHKMVAELDRKIQSGEGIEPDLFKAAWDEIYRLMIKDKFSRYMASQDYKDFLDCLGIL